MKVNLARWILIRLIPFVVPSLAIAALPVVHLQTPTTGSVLPGTTIQVQGTASDEDGTMSEHWLEVKRPAGDWSWEGWLTSEPWGPNLDGDAYSSVKATSFTLTDPGVYVFRTTAYDPIEDQWVISNEVSITVASGDPFTYSIWGAFGWEPQLGGNESLGGFYHPSTGQTTSLTMVVSSSGHPTLYFYGTPTFAGSPDYSVTSGLVSIGNFGYTITITLIATDDSGTHTTTYTADLIETGGDFYYQED